MFFACSPPDACLGGDLRQLARNGTADGKADMLCSRGYRSERCSECDGGYYRFGGACRACPANRLLFFVLCALALVAVLLAAHWVLKLGINLAALTIAVDYFQVLSNFGRFDVHWPEGPRSLLSMFSLVDLNVEAAAPECFLGVSFTRDWATVACLPFVCAGLLALYHAVWRCTAGKRASRVAVRKHAESRAGETLLLLQVMYLTLAGRALQLFDCKQLADGSNVLQAAPYIRCWEAGSEHAALAVLGVVAVALYVAGIPLLFWRVLRWARRLEQAWEAAAPGGGRVRAHELTRAQLAARSGARRAARVAGNLSQRFRAEKWYWLVVVMARRLALVCGFVFFSSRPQTQIALVALALLVALELQHRHRPYAKKSVVQRRQAERKSDKGGGAEEGVELQQLQRTAGALPLEGWQDNPMRASAAKHAGSAAVLTPRTRAERAEVIRRVRHSLQVRDTPTVTEQRGVAVSRLQRLVWAAEDANVMEWVALVSALLVLLAGSLYHAARQELLAGAVTGTYDLRVTLADVFCVSVLVVTCVYMSGMASAPLVGSLWVQLRARIRLRA
ncbi:MAG: hypothetical protein ACK4ZJ_07495 [Allorhizobium sp.]